jgi:putative transposase
MARLPRPRLPDGAYHVTARGTDRAPLFLDDEDRRDFINLLRLIVLGERWRCHAYCLMTNHYHLVLETSRERLSEGMRRLNGRYARRFNWRHDRTGHLFEGRYSAKVIDDERQLSTACAYVLANPVRAGICSRVDDWPWSGRV